MSWCCVVRCETSGIKQFEVKRAEVQIAHRCTAAKATALCCLLSISTIFKKSSPPMSDLGSAPCSSGYEPLISTLATRSLSLSLSLCIYVWKFLSLGEFHWVCFRFGLGSLRCFKFEYVSRRMCKSKRQCGKDSMSLRLTRFMPCAPTSVGFSWRYLEVLPFNFKLVFSRVVCSWIWIDGEGIVW